MGRNRATAHPRNRATTPGHGIDSALLDIAAEELVAMDNDVQGGQLPSAPEGNGRGGKPNGKAGNGSRGRSQLPSRAEMHALFRRAEAAMTITREAVAQSRSIRKFHPWLP